MRSTKRRGQLRSFLAEVLDAGSAEERSRRYWWKRGRHSSVPVSERLRMKSEREATNEEVSDRGRGKLTQ